MPSTDQKTEIDWSRSNRMPSTDQKPDIAPYMRTWWWPSKTSTMVWRGEQRLTVLNLIKCLPQIKKRGLLLTCALISEKPSNTSTITLPLLILHRQMINLCRASKLEIDEWSNFNSIMEPWAADPGTFLIIRTKLLCSVLPIYNG